MLFQEAARLIRSGVPVKRKNMHRGWITIKSLQQSYRKISTEDFLADDWIADPRNDNQEKCIKELEQELLKPYFDAKAFFEKWQKLNRLN